MSSGKNSVDLSDLHYIMGEINGKLDTLTLQQHKASDAIIAQQNKTIYALIALAGATVGLKLMGSPPLLIILSFINGFIFLFTFITAIFKRKQMRGWAYILTFGIMGIIGNIHKVISPANTDIRNLFFIVGNLGLLLFVWQLDRLGYEVGGDSSASPFGCAQDRLGMTDRCDHLE